MSERMLKVLPLGVFGSLLAVLTAGFTPAQEPIPLPLPVPPTRPSPAPPDPNGQPNTDGVEVLAKGPVHEGFAATAEAPTASAVVTKQPPEPIEELPPDQKPAGDNVQWIPGYWHWDEEVSKYIWISGFWRQPPPGRVWVAGSWRETRGGHQWVSGFWQGVQSAAPAQPDQQVQPQIEYLPQQPPESVEAGPTVPAPAEGYFYAPGCWVWRNKYVWRPGVWVEHRTNWLWVPARYHWTPAGYVFCEGYWDYPLATRGVLFAPVAFTGPIQPAFVYTPQYVVSEPCMVGALFVRRGCNNYYFGDYFDRGYGALGYSAWCGTVNRGGFSLGFGVGRNWGYDPLWAHYSATYRDAPTWHRGVGDLYGGRYRGDVARPPVTLVQQNTTINNITRVNVSNVTNNITVVNGAATVGNRDVSNVAMVAPLRVAPDLQRTRFEPVAAEARRTEAVAARQLRDVGTQRTRLETAAVAQPPSARPAPGQPAAVAAAAQPRTINLDVPKAAVARAQISDERRAPPPNPVRPTAGGGAKIDPPRANNPAPGQGIGQPGGGPSRIAPNTPNTNPPAGPAPKADPVRPNPNPTPAVSPKVEPPRVNPNPLPGPAPKVNPPRVNLPPVAAPKVEPPRPNPTPIGTPKIDPVRPNASPKVEPPRMNVPQPGSPPTIVAPTIEPPRPNPPPVAPKVDPVRPNLPPVVAPKVNPQPAPVVAPKVEPPRVNVNPPAPVVPPRPNPQPPAVVNPPRPNAAPFVPPAAPAPKVNPVAPPRPNPPPAPKVNPAPPAPAAPRPNPAPVVTPPAPRVNPAPAPVVAAPPAPRPAPPVVVAKPPAPAPQPPRAAPVIAPRPAPAPVVQPQPPRVAPQPPRAAPQPPRAAPGNPPKKR